MEIAHATTPREAAEIFPANYWFALLELPQEAPFPLLEKKATRLATALGFSGVR